MGAPLNYEQHVYLNLQILFNLSYKLKIIMKKFLLILVGMFVALAAHADLYIVGNNVATSHDGNLGSNWIASAAGQIPLADGYYCFKAQGDFKISTVKADFNGENGFDANARVVGTWTAKAGATDVQTAPLTDGWASDDNSDPKVPGPGNNTSPFGNTETYYRVSADLQTIESSKTTDFGGSVVVTKKLYLIGSRIAPNRGVFYDDRMNPNNSVEVLLDNGYYYFRTNCDVFKISTTKGTGNASNVQQGDWDAFDVGLLKVTDSNWADKAGFPDVKTQNIQNGQTGDCKGPFSSDITYYRINEDLTVMDASKSPLYDITDEHEYSYHLHNYTTLDGTRVQLVKSDDDETILKGSFSYTAPLSVDQNYTVHRFDATTGTFEEFGCENFTYNPAGTTVTLTPGIKGIIMPKDLKGTVNISVKLDGNGTPVEISVAGGEITTANHYTYLLHHCFTSPDGETLDKSITFTAHGWHFDADYVFTGEETGHVFKIERFLDQTSVTGTRYVPVKLSQPYDPTKATTRYDLNNNGIDTDIFPTDRTIRGRIRFTLHVKDDGTPDYLVMRGGTTDKDYYDDNLYTFYYYALPGEVPANLKAIAYRADGSQATIELGDQQKEMKPTGKVITVDATDYEVWARSFTGDFDAVPHKVKFFTDDENAPLLEADFVNYGFYTAGSQTALINQEMHYAGGQEPTVYYMHFKEDWIKRAHGGENNPDADPKCYVYSGSNPDGATAWADGITMERITKMAPAGNMTITDKYQLWKATVPAATMAGTDKVCFVFPGKEDNSYYLYCSRTDNSDEYIWATAEDNTTHERYAVQSYLSYDKFCELDAEGRPSLYLVGKPDGAINNIGWTAWSKHEEKAQDGYFFIPIDVDANSGKEAKFKMSWINARAAAGLANDIDLDEARGWATFDLGIIGVDDLFDYDASETFTKPDMTTDGSDTDMMNVNCKPYESLRYLNYNQYNFVIDPEYIKKGGQCYIVVDPVCRTVTVIPYDPNPTVTISNTGTGKEEFDLVEDNEIVQKLHNHANHLNGAHRNGHVYMTKFNTAKGNVVIHKAGAASLTETFTVQYSVIMNGDVIYTLESKKAGDLPSSIDFKYLPMASSENLTFQALYTNHTTGQSFHSKLSHCTIEGITDSYPTPTAEIKSARIIHDPRDLTYGILAEIECEKEITEKVHNYYGDIDLGVRLKDGTFQKLYCEFLHPTHKLVEVYGELKNNMLDGWTYQAAGTNYSEANNWAARMFPTTIEKDGKKVATGHLYVYLYRAALTKEDLNNLDQIEGTISAVYPFLFQPTPDEDNITTNKAPGRRATSITNIDTFSVNNMENPFTFAAFPISTDNILAGIENVEAGAEQDAEAEYYTISGVRVYGELTPGIYICRKGNTVEKIAIK